MGIETSRLVFCTMPFELWVTCFSVVKSRVLDSVH